MNVEIEFTTEEADALHKFVTRVAFTDVKQLTNTEKEARQVLFALHEIQQAIWKGAENGN